MPEIIIEVHSIASASHLTFFASNEPVACLALVSAIDPTHPSMAPSRQVLALKLDDLGKDFVGLEIAKYMNLVDLKLNGI